MQSDSPQQFRRSKKYDTYVSGGVPVYQNILPDEQQGVYQAPQYQPVSQPSQPAQPVYVTQQVGSVPIYNNQATYQNPVTTPSLSNRTYSAPKVTKKKTKKPALAAIMKATVQLEKVTKNSISVVKQTFEPDELQAMRTKKQKILARTFYAVGVASFMLMMGFGVKQLFKPNNSTSPSSVLGVQTSGTSRVSNDPIEQQPTEQDKKTYLVAPQYPRYIRIPKISVDARVRRLGIDSKGAVAFPTNIYDIGWYDGSVRPGDPVGSSILIGHLMGNTQQGALWNIEKIGTGDSIEIEKGDGTVVRYRVTSVKKTEPGDDLSTFIKPDQPGKHDLKLITASGMYDKVSNNTQQRIVVFATQI